MRIDIHTHTGRYSPCSLLSPEELIRASVRAGLDGIIITEHNYRWKGNEIEELKSGLELPADFFIGSGQEVDSDIGHILLYGCPLDFGINRHWQDILKEVYASGGIAILAHPFRWGHLKIYSENNNFFLKFSGLEIMSANLDHKSQIQGILKTMNIGMPAVGGSDAHSLAMTGTYFTYFPDFIRTECDMINALKEGRVCPGKFRAGIVND